MTAQDWVVIARDDMGVWRTEIIAARSGDEAVRLHEQRLATPATSVDLARATPLAHTVSMLTRDPESVAVG